MPNWESIAKKKKIDSKENTSPRILEFLKFHLEKIY